MKKVLLFSTLLVMITFNVSFGQWINEWNSSPIDYSKLSGWLNFEKIGEDWKSRLYILDSLTFQVMGEGYSSSAQYTYEFTQAEILAGNQLYSLEVDLTGDNITEFYVLGYYGIGTYRQSVKIFDIVTGNVLFERNDPSFAFSYPVIWDLDLDKTLECIIIRTQYPSNSSYSYEVYNTGISILSSAPLKQPIRFELKQNYPNPFNPSTLIEYSLEKSSNVKLQIFDIKGELIKDLVNDYQNEGSHSVKWDGTNNLNHKVATGVYIYKLFIDNQNQTKKMIFLK